MELDKQYQEIFTGIQDAYTRIHQVAHHTPFVRSNTFSYMTGGEIYLKLECLQRTGSFKVRGAYYAISRQLDEIRKRGCVTASAGNHAQGVAYAATSLGVTATIVMPESSPAVKVQATKGYGARVILHGRTYDEAVEEAHKINETRQSVFLHSFDNPDVIAGQGTIGLEMVNDKPDLDLIIVPIGGGGLISGISIVFKTLKPTTEIYGVQALGAPCMVESLKRGKIIELPTVDTIADGIAIKRPSLLTYTIVKNLVNQVVLVDDDEIADATFMILERLKQVAEPAGAVGLAALLSGKIDVKRKKVGIVISGGNINMSLLAQIIERSLYKARRLVKITGLLKDNSETLQEVLSTIRNIRANVITIAQDRTAPEICPGKMKITITLEVPEADYIGAILENLEESGHPFKLAS